MKCACSCVFSFLLFGKDDNVFHKFSTLLSHNFFSLSYFPVFFPKCVKFNELDFFASGEFHEW